MAFYSRIFLGGGGYKPRFTGLETEAQRGQIPCAVTQLETQADVSWKSERALSSQAGWVT